jgi:hypothetical protein
MVAANNKKWEIVNLLLRRGANATISDVVCCNFNWKSVILFIHKTNTTNN